ILRAAKANGHAQVIASVSRAAQNGRSPTTRASSAASETGWIVLPLRCPSRRSSGCCFAKAGLLLSWRIWETGIAADLLQCASLRRARKATHRSIGSADLFEPAFSIREVVTRGARDGQLDSHFEDFLPT